MKKSFYIGALLLALPNILQNLITTSATLIDNLMVGGLQEHAIAGVTITNQVFFIFTIVLFGIGGTAGIFIPQYKGIGNEAKMTEAFKVSLVLSVAFAVVFAAIMFLIPTTILSFFADDEYTIVAAIEYLYYIRWTFFILPISLAIGNAYRFSGYVKTPMYIAFVTVSFGTVLNYALIGGNLGMPAMGVSGAALGTLIARSAELIIFIVLTFIIKSPVKIQIHSFFKLEKVMFKQFIEKGYGLVINEFLWAFGMQLVTVIYTMRISENIAAMSITHTFSSLIFIGMGGVSVVFSLYLGQHLGRGKFDRAKADAERLRKLSMFMGAGSGIVVFALSFLLIGFYDVAPDIIQTSQLLLAVNVGFSWLYYLNASYFFILRSGGDTKGVLIIDSLFTWGVMIPGAFLIGRLGFVLPLHFLLVQSLEVIKYIMASRRYKKDSWLNNLTVDSEETVASA